MFGAQPAHGLHLVSPGIENSPSTVTDSVSGFADIWLKTFGHCRSLRCVTKIWIKKAISASYQLMLVYMSSSLANSKFHCRFWDTCHVFISDSVNTPKTNSSNFQSHGNESSTAIYMHGNPTFCLFRFLAVWGVEIWKTRPWLCATAALCLEFLTEMIGVVLREQVYGSMLCFLSHRMTSQSIPRLFNWPRAPIARTNFLRLRCLRMLENCRQLLRINLVDNCLGYTKAYHQIPRYHGLCCFRLGFQSAVKGAHGRFFASSFRKMLNPNAALVCKSWNFFLGVNHNGTSMNIQHVLHCAKAF